MSSFNPKILKSELKNSLRVILRTKNGMPKQKKDRINIAKSSRPINKIGITVIIKRKDIPTSTNKTSMKIEIVNSDQLKNTSIGSLTINRKEISMRNKDIGIIKSPGNKKIINHSKIIQKNLTGQNQTSKKNMVFSKSNRSQV